MKLTVSTKNEFEIVPDIEDNLERKEEEKFKIIFKKLSSLESNEWSTVEPETGHIKIDFRERLKDSIVKLVNPPALEIDGGEQVDLTIDILLSDTYPELFELQDFIITDMQRVSNETSIDVKK